MPARGGCLEVGHHIPQEGDNGREAAAGLWRGALFADSVRI